MQLYPRHAERIYLRKNLAGWRILNSGRPGPSFTIDRNLELLDADMMVVEPATVLMAGASSKTSA